jgi:hypothetical protein
LERIVDRLTKISLSSAESAIGGFEGVMKRRYDNLSPTAEGER